MEVSQQINAYIRLNVCRFQKISIPPPQRAVGNSEGEGVLKAKFFKGMHVPKLEFPEGWGVQTKKTLCGGSMVIFWKNTMHQTLEKNIDG